MSESAHHVTMMSTVTVGHFHPPTTTLNTQATIAIRAPRPSTTMGQDRNCDPLLPPSLDTRIGGALHRPGLTKPGGHRDPVGQVSEGAVGHHKAVVMATSVPGPIAAADVRLALASSMWPCPRRSVPLQSQWLAASLGPRLESEPWTRTLVQEWLRVSSPLSFDEHRALSNRPPGSCKRAS